MLTQDPSRSSDSSRTNSREILEVVMHRKGEEEDRHRMHSYSPQQQLHHQQQQQQHLPQQQPTPPLHHLQHPLQQLHQMRSADSSGRLSAMLVRTTHLHNHLGELSRGPSSFSRKSLSRQSLDSNSHVSDTCHPAAAASSAADDLNLHHHNGRACAAGNNTATTATATTTTCVCGGGIGAFISSLGLLAVASLILGAMALLLLASVAQDRGGEDVYDRGAVAAASATTTTTTATAAAAAAASAARSSSGASSRGSSSSSGRDVRCSSKSDSGTPEDNSCADAPANEVTRSSTTTASTVRGGQGEVSYTLLSKVVATEDDISSSAAAKSKRSTTMTNEKPPPLTSMITESRHLQRTLRSAASSGTNSGGGASRHGGSGDGAGFSVLSQTAQQTLTPRSSSDDAASGVSLPTILEAAVAMSTLVLVADLCCLMVCCMQCFFASKLLTLHEGEERSAKYLRECSSSRFIAIMGFFISIPTFLVALVLVFSVKLQQGPALTSGVVLGIGGLFCVLSVLQNLYHWRVEKTYADEGMPANDDPMLLRRRSHPQHASFHGHLPPEQTHHPIVTKTVSRQTDVESSPKNELSTLV